MPDRVAIVEDDADQRALLEHFSSLSVRVESLEVPEDTRDAWWADSMVIVKAVR